MSLKEQAVSGARWTSVSTAVATAGQMLQYLILASILGPEQLGLMAMLTLVIGFSQIYADFGINDAIIHRQDTASAILSPLYWITLLIALLVTGVVVSATPFIVYLFDEPRLDPLVWLVAPGIPIAAAGRQFNVLARKELRFRRIGIIEIIAVSCGLIVAVALAYIVGDVTALIFAYLATTTIRSGALISTGWREWHPAPALSFSGLGAYLDFGFWNLSERTVNFVSGRLDQFIIGGVLGAQALGWYNLAWYLVVLPVSRINPVVTNVAFPVFARVQHDVSRLRSGYLQVMRVLAFVNFPLLAGAAAVAGILVPVAFGSAWAPAAELIQLLAIVMIFRSVGNPSGSLLLATGSVKLGFQWNLFVLVTQIPVIYFAARLGGVVAVGLGLIVLQVVYFAPFYRVIIKPLIRTNLREYVDSVLPALTVTLAMSLTVYAMCSYLLEPTWLSLFFAVAAGAVLQLVLCRVFLREDLARFYSLVAANSMAD